MLVERWASLVVPDDLTAFQYSGDRLITNPALAAWVVVPTWEYGVLRALAIGDDAGSVVAALSTQFDESPPAAQMRLERTLARYLLAWIIYLPDGIPSLVPPEQRLQTVYYAITEGCNLRCPYCYASAAKARPGELATHEAADLIDQAADMGAEEFIFTGGEPMLRPDLFELAARSRDRGLRTNLITNGTVIKTAEIADRVASHFSVVTVSIDGGTPEIHERTRGRGTFRSVSRALRLLNDAGVEPKINHVVGPNNVDHLDDLVTFLSAYRIRQTRMVFHAPLGRGLHDGQDLGWNNYRRIHEFSWGSPRAKVVLPDGPRFTKPCAIKGNCGFGGREIYVNSSGEVFPCKVVAEPQQRAGSLRDRSLREMWALPVFERLRKMSVTTLQGCRDCYVRGACGGGCRAHHAGYSGDLEISAERFCRILRHMIVTNMWAGSGVTGEALLEPSGSAYLPLRIKDGTPVAA